MANVKLASKSVGDIVKLNVNGAAKEFIVVHQGNPDTSLYDESCDGTWLLMKDCYESRQWNSIANNIYISSSITTYLNREFFNLLDSDVQGAVKQVKIPHRSGFGSGGIDRVGADGMSCKVFLLSGRETGLTGAGYFPNDGATLDWFEAGSSASAISKRTTTLNGSPTYWWTRSPYTNDGKNAWYISTDGYFYTYGIMNAYGIRPALILPSTLLVSDDGTVSTNTPPTITSPSGATGVSLGEKKDKFSFTYVPHDEDGDSMSIVERLDGVAMKSRTGVASGTSLTFECASTDSGFREILNGEHVITIEVSDGTETATFTASFTKAVHEASIMLETPMAVEGAISVAIMAVVNSIPDDAEYKVEATNNANDDNPVWQDVTAEVKNGTNFVFTNGVAANGSAFNFRITAKRGASGEGGYISAVSGAFQ